MYRGFKILCTICARKGSKGVRNKNIRKMGDKPLIAHSLTQAREAQIFDCIGVSSDSNEILSISKKYGADITVQRGGSLSDDSAPKFPAIKDCVKKIEVQTHERYDILVDLDATSPLRIPADILGAVDLLLDTDAQNIITGNTSRKSPYFNLVEKKPNNYVVKSKPLTSPIYRRQDSPLCYDMNASIYAWKRQFFHGAASIIQERTQIYEMPYERSIDIDSEIEFRLAQFILENQLNRP